MVQKIKCWLGFHNYNEWKTHPMKANWVTRWCEICFHIQDRRLF